MSSPDALRHLAFDVFIWAPVRLDYLLQLEQPAIAGSQTHIQHEVRCAGGRGVFIAAALARWGLRVCLACNPILDDPNGRFLRRELEKISNLTLLDNHQSTLPPDWVQETPYLVHLITQHAPAAHLLRQPQSTLMAAIPQPLPSAPLWIVDETLLTQNNQALMVPHSSHLALITDNASSSFLAHAQSVWWRGEVWPSQVFATRTQQWQCNLLQCHDNIAEWCEVGGKVLSWPLNQHVSASNNTSAVSGSLLGEVGQMEVLWAALLLGQLQGWSSERKFSFARAAASLKRQRIGSVGAMTSREEVLEGQLGC
jgi:hypothetical protein